jgi:hypothetical protein
MFATLNNVTGKFVRILRQGEPMHDYLFTMIVQHTVTPLTSLIRKINDAKPTTFDQLMATFVTRTNKHVTVSRLGLVLLATCTCSIVVGTTND